MSISEILPCMHCFMLYNVFFFFFVVVIGGGLCLQNSVICLLIRPHISVPE